MLDSVYINRRLNLELQNLDIHNASGTRDGPPGPRPLKMGKRFVPGFKRRRDVPHRPLSANLKVLRGLFKGGLEWNHWWDSWSSVWRNKVIGWRLIGIVVVAAALKRKELEFLFPGDKNAATYIFYRWSSLEADRDLCWVISGSQTRTWLTLALERRAMFRHHDYLMTQFSFDGLSTFI